MRNVENVTGSSETTCRSGSGVSRSWSASVITEDDTDPVMVNVSLVKVVFKAPPNVPLVKVTPWGRSGDIENSISGKEYTTERGGIGSPRVNESDERASPKDESGSSQ